MAVVGEIVVVVVVVVVRIVFFEAFVVVVFGAGTAAEGGFVGIVVAGKGSNPLSSNSRYTVWAGAGIAVVASDRAASARAEMRSACGRWDVAGGHGRLRSCSYAAATCRTSIAANAEMTAIFRQYRGLPLNRG